MFLCSLALWQGMGGLCQDSEWPIWRCLDILFSPERPGQWAAGQASSAQTFSHLPHISFFYLQRAFRGSGRPAWWWTLTKQQILLQSLILFPDNLSTLPLDILPLAESISTSPGWPLLRWKNTSLFRLGSSIVLEWASKRPKERKQRLIIVVYFI